MVFSFQFTPTQNFLSPIDVVNFCMASIGREPVDSLVENQDVDVGLVLNELNAANMEVQANGADGWSFNSNEDITLPLNVDGTISLPYGTIAVRAAYWARGAINPTLVTERPQGQLYDQINATNIFTAVQQVDYVVLQDFTTIPQVFRNYIGKMAAFRFQAKKQSSQIVTQVTQEELARAQAAAFQHDDYARPQNSINANKAVNFRLYGWGTRRNRMNQ